jgi:mono/diheme cytochrome c family protein
MEQRIEKLERQCRWYRNLFILAGLMLVGGQAAIAAGSAAEGEFVYMINCITCHNEDPSKKGSIGPEIKGSSKALVSARVLYGKYPKGYKPKRATKIMKPKPYLKGDIDDLAAFLK